MTRIQIIPPFLVDDSVVDTVSLFRGEVWGDVPASVLGRITHEHDPKSWHIWLFLDDVLIGCARYCRGTVVELGGFAVRRRGTRDALRIVNATIALASELDDSAFKVYASVESGSASILEKIGGRRYSEPEWNPDYLDTSVMIMFDGLPAKKRL